MEYLLITSKDKSETSFFINLFRKMYTKAALLSPQEIEDIGLLKAMKQSEKSGVGKLSNVNSHLDKIIARK